MYTSYSTYRAYPGDPEFASAVIPADKNGPVPYRYTRRPIVRMAQPSDPAFRAFCAAFLKRRLESGIFRKKIQRSFRPGTYADLNHDLALPDPWMAWAMGDAGNFPETCNNNIGLDDSKSFSGFSAGIYRDCLDHFPDLIESFWQDAGAQMRESGATEEQIARTRQLWTRRADQVLHDNPPRRKSRQ